MTTRLKYQPLLGPLLQQPSFTPAEAAERGIPRYALAYLVERGDLERLGRGIYRSSSYIWEESALLEDLVVSAANVRNGIVCLISALKYYGLTEEIVRHHWLAVPNNQWAPKTLPHLRVVRMRNVTLGRRVIRIAGHNVAIFDRERCVVDAFRHLSIEVAIKSLRAYLLGPEHKPNLRKLVGYARKLRVNLEPYLIAFST